MIEIFAERLSALRKAEGLSVNELGKRVHISSSMISRYEAGERTGDVTQIDLPRKSDSGLVRAMEILRHVEGIGIVEFDKRDIVRHPLVKYIVEAFDRSAGAFGSFRLF